MTHREIVRATGQAIVVVATATVCGALTGFVWQQTGGADDALWLVARATGACAVVLLTTATVAGIVLSHPSRARLRWPAPATRVRLHVSTAVFALVFTVLHVLVVAVDPHFNIGWAGALLPFAAAGRPVTATLGVISLWSGAAAGLTAALSGRVTISWWRGLHRLSAFAWAAAWVHAVLAGSDTGLWVVAYVAMGLAVLGAAWWRYAAKPSIDCPENAVPQAVPVNQGHCSEWDLRARCTASGRTA